MNSQWPAIKNYSKNYHHETQGFRDTVAYYFVRGAVVFANIFFRERYGHRAIVLETLAAIPGMVGGLLQHLKALRHIRDDHGWIKTLIDEAENERMHLMIYAHIAKPTMFERLMIVFIQTVFYIFYFLVYLFSPRTGHRLVGYLEEEAVRSYMHYLLLIDTHKHRNVQAPEIAVNYWKLSPDARLRDVIIATIDDEIKHRDTNHSFADKLD